MVLNNQGVNQEVKEVKKHGETEKNENAMLQNFWDVSKVLIGKFIAI